MRVFQIPQQAKWFRNFCCQGLLFWSGAGSIMLRY